MRRIVERVPGSLLMKDLEKYRRLAISLGAADAKIITADQVLIDERVSAKCAYPKCHGWGTSLNCPPHAMKPEQTRLVIARYRYGIFYTKEYPPETWLGREPDLLARRQTRQDMCSINAKVEAAAFYDGHYLAIGFWNGSCKTYLCPDIDCAALQAGKSCRFPLKARSSMEAVGMDAMMMATKVGWDIYPCGVFLDPSEVPFIRFLGLVLVC